MKAINIPITYEIKDQQTSEQSTKQFYDEATEDYEFWSKDFNMHFGYFRMFKTNPLRRDSMLNEMNKQILSRLTLKSEKNTLADLGCGMGGTMRYALTNYPYKSQHIFGVTLSPFQVHEGNKLLQGLNGLILEENYNNTSFKNNSIDGAYAIESFCHDGHSNSSFKEAYRILKPGAKLVVADAFLKKKPSELCYGSRFCYSQLCKGWNLKRLASIEILEKELSEIGFSNISIEDKSFRVAPSVFHVPFAITGFILRKLFRRKPLKKESWNNLKGSLFALLSGLHMKSFGYYLITVTK
ncbi:MAG: methyltransferase domain-containing protein [Flavobacteriaceae bacterium]|nr:methyltransferase domain-containing protein [Flavobacteriaceae bacterium]